ncbi:MAG: AAA family ATPase [Cyanothece sp. SIO2G6]|nr:AAA family ATPase [Cyanothece sp. SIO2G6]
MAIVTDSSISNQLPGYTFVRMIYQGSRTAVYQAQTTATQQPVVIKILTQTYPTFAELIQFRNQFMVTKNLPISGIVRPLSLEPCDNGYALVMEDIGAMSLVTYAEQHSLGLADILDIAIQLAHILHELHQHRVIHKDIKPANILIHPTSKQVKLIDFSIASLLPQETQTMQSPKSLEGTLAYLAPEQTGRMNRAIDYRTDFYAFGVTFYQLLTQQLPFTSDDPLALIHCHMAQLPRAVEQINPTVPAVVGAIAHKLMAKNAEDRYQSALGLKHDLEQCLSQWQQQGEITEFVLGERDVSDRFLIPEKLYGRKGEVQTLLNAFERVVQGASELMLVAGFSGIGKTAVINEVHKPIVQQRGYFIKGKFDQFNRNIPFSAFVQAFRDLAGQLLSESDAELQTWKTQILMALGDNAQIIVDLIPELEWIIGEQPAAPKLSGTAAQNRFNLLFQRFTQVFATAEHPLVIFIDDLQWADSASLKLMRLLLSEAQTGYILVLGAYRDNEVLAAHPLMLTLEAMAKAGTRINTITLPPLSERSVNYLLADTLHVSLSIAQPLTKLVMQKTQGNPFFVTQFLKALHQDGLIIIDHHTGCWRFDLDRGQDVDLSQDVVKFMAQQLQKLPAPTQEVLKLAACIGAQFDLETLTIVSEKSQAEVATALWPALKEGFVQPQNNTYKLYLEGHVANDHRQVDSPRYRFLHDRAQQAAHHLLSDTQQQTIHLVVGRQLWHNLSAQELDEQLFTVVNHLNNCQMLITDPAERHAIAQLNLRASQKAKMAIAYKASCQYCQAGQQFLNTTTGQNDYPTWLELSITEIEAEFFGGNLDVAEQLAHTTLLRTETLLDRIRIHHLQILFEIYKNCMTAAIDLALNVLTALDIHIPNNPQEIESTIKALRDESALPIAEIANLINLSPVQDETALAVIQILTNASSAAYIANPLLHPIIVLQTACYCIQYGNSALAASAYSWYGALLCGTYKEIERGYEFGKLSIQILEKWKAKQLIAKVSNMFNVFIRPWKEPLKNAIADLPNAIQGGFENGDIEYALYATVHYCNYLFYSGDFLPTVSQTQAHHLTVITKTKYGFHEGFLRINQQVVANLLGETLEPQVLQGQVFSQDLYLPQWEQHHLFFLLLCFYTAQTRLAYLFEEYQAACLAGERGTQYQQAAQGTLYVVEQKFYYSLALLTQESIVPDELEQIAHNHDQLRIWAAYAPDNFQHKYDLLEAERCRFSSDYPGAIAAYEGAIAHAKTHGYTHEEALANELAAKFYLNWDKKKVAAGYMQEAYYCYSRWGANAKVAALEARYPELLQPILQPPASSETVLATLSTLVAPVAPTPSGNQQHPSRKGLNQTLDLASVLRSTQVLSSTIQIDELLRQLTQIILQNSGGDRCALILPRDGMQASETPWQVSAIATPQTITIQTESLETQTTLPVQLIQYVKRTRQPLILDASTAELPVIDQYLSQHQPKSILCLPLMHKNDLVGIVYVQNQFTQGVFTDKCLTVLTFLCTQAAVSLENAMLYHRLEHYNQCLEEDVAERTQELQTNNAELQKTLDQLQQTQARLIQAERLSALGKMVSGIAHEINNPNNFIYGNVAYARSYCQDLLQLIELYEQPEVSRTDIVTKREEIDLEFLQTDLEHLLASMEIGSLRIREVVQGLRRFSGLDEAAYKQAHIHDGLDSVLLMLRYHFTHNRGDRSIQLVKQYGDIPELYCYPCALNQVFFNLIANAIEALTFTEAIQNPTITIHTSQPDPKIVQIRIADNGPGIPSAIQDKIFIPFFTTKPVGKGTGLGLAIAYQVVVETHSGMLEVESSKSQGTVFQIRLPLHHCFEVGYQL